MQLKPFAITDNHQPKTKFSIIIPARDEAKNIGHCLSTIFLQDYPSELFEVIVINDHSVDDTAAIIESMQLSHPNLVLINLADHLQDNLLNSYKKKAIELAISKSKGDWIVTTDADCSVKQQWLKLFDSYIETAHPVLVAAPVMFVNEGSFLSVFQLLDFISLQGITAAAVGAGSHAMCNGANLAYEKKAFYAVGQFKGIDTIASGDDMLLMQKIKQQFPGRLGYLFSADAIVETLPMQDWKGFINQRIRWASKADSYQDRNIFLVLLLVYLMNLVLLVLMLVSIFYPAHAKQLVLLVLVKTFIELIFMYPVSTFFGHQKALIWFPFLQPFHIFYTVVAGWLGKFGSYQWKGRKVQ